MNIESLDGAVHVTLSRRNITELLSLLDEQPDFAWLSRNTPKGALIVSAEEDYEHYRDREGQHPVLYSGPG